jgi:hypothetical protein
MHETYRDKTVGICVRKWAKQDSIYHAEDRCGCANSEHEGYDDGESEDRIATEAAKAVADVLNKLPGCCDLSVCPHRTGSRP